MLARCEQGAVTGKLDVVINRAMKTITGCMRFTSAIFLLVLAGLEPIQIRKERCCPRMVLKALEPKQLLHEVLNNHASTWLKS